MAFPAAIPAGLDLTELTRGATPLRVAFLHPPVARGGPGPLADFVRKRRAAALDLLLFAHTVWPLRDAGFIRASSSAWGAAIGLADPASSRALISRSWDWLEKSRLVQTTKVGKFRAVEILREDGSGMPWMGAFEEVEPFFHLPLAYWTGGFSRDLNLPGKALLLIGLSLQTQKRSYFELPVERGAAWYGLTPRSVQTGLQELRDLGLLRTWVHKRSSTRSPVGYTYDRRHALNELNVVARGRILRNEALPPGLEGGEDIPFEQEIRATTGT
jgi:hypothetical protein